MIPSQRANTPVSPRDISKAVFEESKVEFMIAVNISVSPRKITFIRAITKAMMKNAIQMLFRTIVDDVYIDDAKVVITF